MKKKMCGACVSFKKNVICKNLTLKSDFDGLTSPSIETWKTMAKAKTNYITMKFDVFLVKLRSLIFIFSLVQAAKAICLFLVLNFICICPIIGFVQIFFFHSDIPELRGLHWLWQVMWHTYNWWHHSILSTWPNDSTTLVKLV